MPWISALASLVRRPVRALIRAWVEVRLIEPDPASLGLSPTAMTIYVLPHPALTDRLLLETLCARSELPEPNQPLSEQQPALSRCVSLPGRRRKAQAPFLGYLEWLHGHPEQDLELLPVSVFWGRAPGKRFGFWSLITADDWGLTGRLRRALAVLVHGRSVEVHFGAPLSLRALIERRPDALTNRKVARLLRVHFRRQRTRVLGPDLSHRRTLIDGVVASPTVREAIAETAESEGRQVSRVKARARRYGREIASNMTYPVLRLLDGLLERLWTRLYDGVDVEGIEAVKALAGDHTLVYVPCHRSHIDYLLLSYVLFHEGLMPPHIAAGRNLNMPVIGPLLRRGGAFFMRRSFKGNRLYRAVFQEYLARLLSRGHPLEYFIEGGRSRSGRLLDPRPGMLAMTLRAHVRGVKTRGHSGKLAFIPVAIGYERVIESDSYRAELAGKPKRRETPLGLLRVFGRLRQPFGRVSVTIGAPLPLSSFLDAETPEWRHASDEDWQQRAVPRLGEELARRINAAVPLNAVNLVALVLLATPHRAIERDLLERQLELLVDLARSSAEAIGTDGSTPAQGLSGSPAEWIPHVESLGFIERRHQVLGELVLASPEQTSLLSWYRNNVLHHFALAGLVAFAFRNNVRFSEEELHALLAPGWPVLVRELYITPETELATALRATLDRLVDQGLLEVETRPAGDKASVPRWRRPSAGHAGREQLHLLGRLIQPSLERGYLLLASLLRLPSGSLTRDQLAEQSGLLAERLTLLSGLDAPEFFDRRLFAGLVTSLEADGWTWPDEDGRLCYGAELTATAERVNTLFDPALRHRLQQLAAPTSDAAPSPSSKAEAEASTATPPVDDA
ncbi:glycerol-3-phosphate acyltransferase [Onishia taeanensis]|uniref:Glycerol-3-phosphate acyltransferase n=1 Tax=Onishia taeanensis TaxID=284577 RepID=A0A1G7PC81_9GAMM|nr:glycerol-3-phosphate 1-O-acyltransferase PlsB [Halomonas taeanensis]SDF83868.1 glycerol-3-phosphate acyltransferase [Halomonas taeanensis]